MAHERHNPNVQMSQWLAGQFPPGYQGWAIDVGASDGRSVNSTWWLEKALGWTVLSVEANPDFWPMLIKERAFVAKSACAAEAGVGTLHINVETPEAHSALVVKDRHGYTDWKETEVRVETVDELLKRWDFPRLDALCVDVEGGERAVFEGAGLPRWKPKVIIAEAWKEGTDEEYLAQFGYKRVWHFVDNDYYLAEDK